MRLFLIVLGIVTIIGGILLGIFSGTLVGFVSSVIGSLFPAAILFALAKFLENQESILGLLSGIYQNSRTEEPQVNCTHCGKAYAQDYSSCPYCGRK